MSSEDAAKSTDAAAEKPDLAKKADPTIKGAAPTPETDAPTVKVTGTEPTVKAAVVADAPAAAAPVAPPAVAGRGKSSSTGWIAAAVAGVVAIGAITAGVVFFIQDHNRGERLDAVTNSTAAACAFGNTVSTYDHQKDLDKYFENVLAGATGSFAKEFGDAQAALKDAMKSAQVKSWAEDVQCGFVNGSTDSAKVLLSMTQYRTNFTQTTPDRQQMIVEADMELRDGKWLVSKLDSPLLKGAPSGAAPTTQVPPTPAPAPAPR
ncbi:hypothetical protein [Nocardia camponoti]|uniref:Mce-associated membrane protein n=1 Tax=Nocardia camponoti TaxID=1616106 RepID=A0A917QJP7_9NOCA|nr:hypothetical protein [Nocardia camponoti]GGK54288.1 hypothetical protein GCM10011591_27590 [Nocardia camponoti]